MHKLAGFMATVAAMLAASPIFAQTYHPSYPVCLQVYGIEGGYISCGYTSMAQCRLSASGRAAQCIVNPYFAGAPARGRTNRGPYRAAAICAAAIGAAMCRPVRGCRSGRECGAPA